MRTACSSGRSRSGSCPPRRSSRAGSSGRSRGRPTARPTAQKTAQWPLRSPPPTARAWPRPCMRPAREPVRAAEPPSKRACASSPPTCDGPMVAVGTAAWRPYYGTPSGRTDHPPERGCEAQLRGALDDRAVQAQDVAAPRLDGLDLLADQQGRLHVGGAVADLELDVIDREADAEHAVQILGQPLGEPLLGVVHVVGNGVRASVMESSIQRAGSGSMATRSGDA